MAWLDKKMLTQQINDTLTKIGCTDVKFDDSKENLVLALFNCKEVISFNANLPGWQYTGIQLDPTHEREYKIEFSKAQ